MKKYLSMFLILVLTLVCLTSCSSEIGSYLKNYDYKPDVVENISLNMYIIVEDGTSDNALTTVKRMINQHTVSEYNITLNLFYVKASEYEKTVTAAVAADTADIVLINSKALFQTLAGNGSLFDLTDYFRDTSYGFATLNTVITPALLAATAQNGAYYTVPNNHVVGSYRYLLIDKAVARDELKYSNALLASYDTYEKTEELRTAMENAGYIPDEKVKVVTGGYADKEAYEADGYVCNIISYPEVTGDEAFSSGFAIVKHASYESATDTDKAKLKKDRYARTMQILYNINTDTYLRNLLQYGVRGTNYTLDENGTVTRVSTGENVYYMNLLYTGDIFRAYYCDAFGWNKAAEENGKKQNDESLVTAAAKTE